MKKSVVCTLGVLVTAALLGSLYGCGNRDGSSGSPVSAAGPSGAPANSVQAGDEQPVAESDSGKTQADGAQNATESAETAKAAESEKTGTADDDWYRKGSVYTDEQGRNLEVFFNDEGMLEFAIDGLTVYFTTVDRFQMENDWRIYTCDDKTVIIYYPGTPAHLEISDGEYAGLYEENGGKAE